MMLFFSTLVMSVATLSACSKLHCGVAIDKCKRSMLYGRKGIENTFGVLAS